MISPLEVQQDNDAHQETVRREQDIDSRRRDLAKQANAIAKKAARLQAKVADMDPEAEATAELTGALEDLQEEVQWVQYGVYRLTADALAVVLLDGDVFYPYSPADVKAWVERADELEATRPTIQPQQLRDLVWMRQVPNAPFRERYLAGDYSEAAVIEGTYEALRAQEEDDGQEYGAKHFMVGDSPQTRWFQRLLGIQATPSGSGKPGLKIFIPYEVGVAFMRALDMTPQESGL